jgi:hypothetical protein
MRDWMYEATGTMLEISVFLLGVLVILCLSGLILLALVSIIRAIA